MTTQIQTATATNEVTVNLATGEAFISFAEAAKRLNVPKTTLYDCINRTVKADTKQGLSSEMLSVAVQYFALDAKTVTTEAKELLRKISQAGAKAYLYHEAGLSIGVTQQRPLTQLEAYEELVRMEKTRLALLDTVGAQQKVIDHKRNITNEGEDYFTVAAVKPLNQGIKLSGSKLSREADDQELPPIKQHSMYGVNTPYAYHRDIWEAVYPEIELPE